EQTKKNSWFFFSSRRRHTRWPRDWSSDVCSSDLVPAPYPDRGRAREIISAFTVSYGSRDPQTAQKFATLLTDAFLAASRSNLLRSEERRVGKEGRTRWCWEQ